MHPLAFRHAPREDGQSKSAISSLSRRILWRGLLAMLSTRALARDDGRYDNFPLKSWFESLQTQFVKCCIDF
jgi:hypothetical protein